MTAALLRLVRRRIDPRPLAATRIALAVAALLKTADLAVLLPELASRSALRLPYSWSPLLVVGPALAWGVPAVAAAAAIALALGWHARPAAFALAAALFTALAADRQAYSNHLWLLVCLIALLGLTDCGAARSLDARRRGAPASSVAAWPARLLQTQATAVYAFAVLAKLNPDFLSGEVLAVSLREAGTLAPPAALRAGAPLVALALAAVAVEAFLPIALWIPRLRWAAYVLGAGLHLTIVAWMAPALHLAVFGIAMVSVYPLFAVRSTLGSSPPPVLLTSARATPRPATASTSISTPP